ncbi:MAG: C25 family cysteine peptidase, partial [bacterium]
MRRSLFVAAAALAAFSFMVSNGTGEWIYVGDFAQSTPVVELLESSASGCLLEIRVPRIWVEDVAADGRVFQRLSLPEAGIAGRLGEPELPVYARWLTLPPTASLRAELVDADYVEIDGYNVYPVQRPLPGQMVDFEEFVISPGAYSRDEYSPDERAAAGTECLLRDLRIAEVSVYPIQFNPARQKIRVATRMRVKVDFSGHSSQNVPRRTDTGTKAFQLLQKSFVLNYAPTAYESGSYLIIAADAFASAVQPLADWKNRKGLPTVLRKLSEIPPGDSGAIHDYIRTAYDTWQIPPEWVLLVGDVEFLPTGMHEGIYPPPWGYYNYFGTDHPFSLVAGDDIFSDIFIGRLPVNSAEECSIVVNKLLDYETTPDTANLGWFERATTVGVKQPGRIFQKTCRKIKSIMLSSGYAQVDTLFEGSSPPGFATPKDICDSLNDGRTFLVFRGHGGQDGWWTDGSYNILATAHVDTLRNRSNYPVVIAPTCLANAFFDENQECMGEAFLLQSDGAAGYFGATDVSYSYWNDSLAIGIFRGIFQEGNYHFQQGCNYGKLFMEKYFPLSNPDTAEITSQEFFFMNILGDPELPLWTDTPQPLVAVHVDTIGTGSRLLFVYVESQSSPVADALVCAMKETETYASGYTDASGFVTLAVSPATEGIMVVTATARNCLPYAARIMVVTAPAVPELLSPGDLTIFADSVPQFVWSTTAGDSGYYELTLAEDSLFTVNPVTVDSLADTTYSFPAGLEDCVYFWGVEAFNENHVGSGYQAHRFSFTLDCTPPEFFNTTLLSDTSYQGPFDIYSMITDFTGVFST